MRQIIEGTVPVREKLLSRIRIGAALVAASMLAVGCQDGVLDAIGPTDEKTDLPFEETEVATTLLASVALDDGSIVDFLEVEDGIVITGTAADWEDSLVRSAFDLDESGEPVAIYERLANAPAPDVLVTAQRRVNRLIASSNVAQGTPSFDGEMEIGGAKIRSGEQPDLTIWSPGIQSGSYFVGQYCNREFTNLNWTLIGCYTDVNYSAWSPYRYSTGQLGVAHCKSGVGLLHTLLKYNFASASWQTVLPLESISTGQSSWFYRFGTPAYHRSAVYNVGSWERFHFTFKTLYW